MADTRSTQTAEPGATLEVRRNPLYEMTDDPMMMPVFAQLGKQLFLSTLRHVAPGYEERRRIEAEQEAQDLEPKAKVSKRSKRTTRPAMRKKRTAKGQRSATASQRPRGKEKRRG